MNTYIFGHRNPDTDTVCSSICLSYLMNEEGYNTIPKVLGHLNLETKFVLNYFKVKEPDYLNDTKVQVKDINYNKLAIINEDEAILKAIKVMQKQSVNAIPIINNKKYLVGFISLKEIMKYLINTKVERVISTYDNLLYSLNGKEIVRINEDIKGTINLDQVLSNDDIIIGNLKIEEAILAKVKLIVLTKNDVLKKSLINKAIKNKVNIIVSNYNEIDTYNRILLSNKIKSINTNTNPTIVHNKDYRSDVISLINKVGHTNYPVINSKNECVGLLKAIDIDNFVKKDVILVDHNDLDISAIGIEEANIREIIDHHNLSSIGFNRPINFRCMPVGATATIIYNMFLEKEIEIPLVMAGLMLSAILSDTLVFKSPTTTKLDIEAAQALAKITNINIDTYGYQMFKAASSIKKENVNDLINSDFKSYNIGNYILGISQIMTMDFCEIKDNIDVYKERLNQLKLGNYIAVVLFITDVYKNGSYVIYDKDSEDIIKEAFALDDIYEGVYIDNLVSRKKQMLPALLEVIQKKV